MEEFLKIIEEFLVKTGMSPTVFGLKATKNPNFVFLVRSGRQCLDSTKNKVLNFINNYSEEKNENTFKNLGQTWDLNS